MSWFIFWVCGNICIRVGILFSFIVCWKSGVIYLGKNFNKKNFINGVFVKYC